MLLVLIPLVLVRYLVCYIWEIGVLLRVLFGNLVGISWIKMLKIICAPPIYSIKCLSQFLWYVYGYIQLKTLIYSLLCHNELSWFSCFCTCCKLVRISLLRLIIKLVMISVRICKAYTLVKLSRLHLSILKHCLLKKKSYLLRFYVTSRLGHHKSLYLGGIKHPKLASIYLLCYGGVVLHVWTVWDRWCGMLE